MIIAGADILIAALVIVRAICSALIDELEHYKAISKFRKAEIDK